MRQLIDRLLIDGSLRDGRLFVGHVREPLVSVRTVGFVEPIVNRVIDGELDRADYGWIRLVVLITQSHSHIANVLTIGRGRLLLLHFRCNSFVDWWH